MTTSLLSRLVVLLGATTLALCLAPASFAGTRVTNTPVDIAIAIDTTGSMGSSITQAQEDARRLVRNVKTFAPNVNFAIVQFRDKNEVPDYKIEQAMTADSAAVETALNRLSAGGGGDNPEAYTLVFREIREGPVGWRTGSRKIVVVIGDAEPHGAGSAGYAGCADTTSDPWSLSLSGELAGLKAGGFTLIMIRQASTASASLQCYQSLVAGAAAGGAAKNGGEDVLAVVEGLVKTAISTPTTGGGKFKPGKGLDIAIAIDTTGSMGSSIAQAQEDARKLVRNVKKFAPDVAFSVVQFRDKGDTPEYQVEQVMTADAAKVEAALNRLSANGGGDYPEAYALTFRNLRDPAIGWRASSRKLVVVIGDAEPHGAGTAGLKGCTDTSTDPFGADVKVELAGLSSVGFSLIMIRQASTASASLECYASMAALAYKGGAAKNGGEDVLGVVEALIEKAVVKDTKAPKVSAINSSGKAGTKVKLRYRVSDDSGKTADEIKVYDGSKVIGSGKTKLGPAVAGKIYNVGWTTAASLAGKTFRFCIRSQDPSGNLSGWSCAHVKLT
jgi:Mg-chelatase subunit ChlD